MPDVFAPPETALLDEEHLRLALGGGGAAMARATFSRNMNWLVPTCFLGARGKRWIWGDVLRRLRERGEKAA